MRAVLLLLLRIYKIAFSPLVGMHCRFYPTCSDYAREAVEVHGAFRGGALAVRRLCRCHPFVAGGLDPVPEAKTHAPVRKTHRFPFC